MTANIDPHPAEANRSPAETLTSIEDIQRDVSRIAQSLGRVSVPRHADGRHADATTVKTANVNPVPQATATATTQSGSAPDSWQACAARVLDFTHQLEQYAERGTDRDQLLGQCGRLLGTCLGFVGHYTPAGTRIGEATRLEGLTAPLDGLDGDLRQTLQQCCEHAQTSGHRSIADCGEHSRILAVPVRSTDGQVLVGIEDSQSGQPGLAPLLLDLAALQLSKHSLQETTDAADRGSRHTAALVELIAHLERCRDIEDGAGRLGRELQRYLHAARVVVGHCEDEDSPCIPVSDTAQPDINPLTEDTQLIQAMLEECVSREAPSMWPPQENEQRHALLAHQQVLEFTDSTAIVSCPLTVDEDHTIGAVCLIFGSTPAADLPEPLPHNIEPLVESEQDDTAIADLPMLERAATGLHFLSASQGPLAATLALLDRTAPGLWQQLHRGWRHIYTQRRRRAIGIVIGAVTALMLIPMHYNIDCDAELQPVSRRFVAAPFAGTLQECLVRPGEYVEKDMLLALMDEREIEYERAGIQADLSRARTEQKSHRADHKFSDAAIATHEVDRLKHRSDLLTYRSNHLELRSPIDGIVVSGDHKDSEGVPLETGESLFEIAPLDAMTIEVAVPEEDIRWVSVGMPIRLQLDAMPAQVVHANVLRVHPSAELRDHDNVFIVEAEITNADGLFRPGMRGAASIRSDRHFLGWNLFHKPTAHLTGWLGW